MARDDKAPLRITPWPARPLPHPGHDAGIQYMLGEAGGIMPVYERAEPHPLHSTVEAYLHLTAVDLDDPEAIMDFVRIFGPLEIRWHRGFLRESPPYGGFALHPGFTELQVFLEEGVDAAADEFGCGPGQVPETLDEFRYGATLMRDLVACWRKLRDGVDPETWHCPIWRLTDVKYETYPWLPDGPAAVLHSVMGDGLEPYSPQLLIFREGDEPSPIMGAELPLWNLLCLELYNDIIANAEYRICANANCGRLFSRQSGRAEHGQHRTRGVKFCSASCARAQAQRDYRRRQAAAKNSDAA